MMKQWRDIKGYENLYRASTDGEIYSVKSEKVLKPFYRGSRQDNKYLAVELHRNKVGQTMSVHRIIAETFIKNPNNLPCVNHKDGNKDNNCVDNLEWCTYSENNYHAINNGLKKYKRGSKHKNSKLTYEDVVEIKKCLILGDAQYGSRPLGEKYGVDHNVILDIYHQHKYQDVKIPYTFFVCSDIHSAYTPWMDALKQAGFNQNKYSHKIILCGDLFDRMDESQQVYKFAKEMIDEHKLIYIKGNHEQLLVDCCNRGWAMSHDLHNGTAKTIFDLGYGTDFKDMCAYTLKKIDPLLNVMVNYFETKNYIFVHSWIPLIKQDNLPAHYTRNRKFEFDPNWRNAGRKEWHDAMWGNPFDMVEMGLVPEKTIVFGHWHCSTGWARAEGNSEFGEDAKFDPYYGDGFIAIDACTAHSGKVNVIVIEDEFMENGL